MVLKHLLARIFKRFKKSGSASALDITFATTPAPASDISSICISPLTARSPATQAIFPVDVNLRFHVVMSPTADGARMPIQSSQVLPTLGTTPSNSSVEFNIDTTVTQPTEIVDTIPDCVISPIQRLNFFGLGTTCPQGMQIIDGLGELSLVSVTRVLSVEFLDERQFSNMTALTQPASLTVIARDSDIQCLAPVEVEPRTALMTPHSPLSEFVVATPVLARTVQTIESKDIETPPKCAGSRSHIRIAGPSVGPTAEVVVPSMVPTIPNEPSSQTASLGLQQYDFLFPHFPRGQSLPPATHVSSQKLRLDPQRYDSLIPQPQCDQLPAPAPHEPPRCPPGLKHPIDRQPGVQPGHLRSAPSVHPSQQGSPFELPQDVSKRSLDNDALPRPPRGNTGLNLADVFPTLESSASNFQPYNCSPIPKLTQASTTIERISNNGRLAYSIQAGGHKYVATVQVGSGGFGYVWYAIKDETEEVAIKVIDKAGLLAQFVHCTKDKRPTTQQLLEGSQAAAAAISSEYEAFKRVTEEQSPFLTPLLHAFEDEDNFYFVMRFYPQTLRTRAKFGFMHWQLRLVAAELLLALQHLHKLRIVHLDLKMENVLVTPSGHVCIADFGNAEVLDRKLTYQQFHDERMYGASGTDGYLPPERVEGDQGYNFKTDTWTYGSILLELLLINGYNVERRLALIRPSDEINLIQDKDAKDLLYSIFFPQHHIHVDYKCPTELVHDTMHGATCRAPGTKVPRRHVCTCDLPADWNKG
ncbi:hypothetical protein BDR07DRAFT_540014 [Suillus spraguei]|nr:hypothetical protein BDR07DRAFT_540014 [Suillus spraguei]